MRNPDEKNGEHTRTKNTRDRIAKCMIYGSLAVLLVLAAMAILVVAIFDPNALKETSQNIFNGLLPLFGAWVGAVLAFYFSKDNFQTASESVRDTVREFNPQLEKLRQRQVKDVMVPIGAIKYKKLEPEQGEEKLMIKTLVDSLKEGEVSRIPVLDENNVVRYVLHQSMLYKFIAKKSMEPGEGFQYDKATLQDFLRVEGMKKMVASTLAFVAIDRNLADAKSSIFTFPKQRGDPRLRV
ncbi:hypothetical protein [Nitrosomonas halophila]|uniref:CBS domain-containing protein n=1 Tax=Nitrosomonas halophila TaxID=44576 RepID=A0A1H3BEN6_9PROT|nr:hypothetical protein [Nitrosomonas halophila]SDX40470.1 hypothetical protein SAMN05421881_10015 [Nitrosomonas halophila]